MVSSLIVRCPVCETVYKLSTEDLNVLLLFRCNECGQYNVYVSGHVLMLDKNIMDKGTESEKRRHLIGILQNWACEFAGNVLKNVNRVIDVNMDAGLRISDSWNFDPCDEGGEETEGSPASRMHPTILWGDAPEITKEEVSDFISIDLELIDREWYFNRFFGSRNR